MNGLSGSRVLLVDDEPREALPVIRALSRMAVPVAYFDGKLEGLPAKSKRLKGIRLAILDMNLGYHGSPGTIAAPLVQMLSRIMSPNNGPYGILIWTNHPDLRDATAEYIFKHPTLPNPVFIAMLKKADFLKRSGTPKVSERFSIAKFSKRIVAELEENSPLECMQVWEGSSFAAATNVTNGLAQLTGTSAPDLSAWGQAWREELLKLLFVIGRAQAEQHLTSENVLNSILLALNPLQSDRLDALVELSVKELSGHTNRIMTAQGGSDPERKGRVNTMLHFAKDHLDRFSPGNLYVFGKKRKPTFLPSLRQVIQDCVDGSPTQRAERLPVLLKQSRVVAVELTPACDFAQDKIGLSRLIAGFAFPYEQKGSIKNGAAFLKVAGPFLFATRSLPKGVHNICLNSRFVASAKVEEVRKLNPAARVRPQLLADLQSWAAYQGARQGVMLLK